MTHVHYKFSSKLSYDTVVFDGPHITLRDLKRQIMGREKLRAADCDLQITNAQTKEEYKDDEGPIPKGSSVIVRRIPVIGVKSGSSSKTRNIERSDVHLHHTLGAVKATDDQTSSRALPLFSKMANLADADVSEEDKIRVMINQSMYDSMNYKTFGTALPANYTCYRCGNSGHHIRNCPTSGQDKNVEAPPRIKKSTGIPRSFMVEVDDPNIKGAMLTNCGRYAIPAIDAQAYAIGKKEKPPFVPQEQLMSEGEEDPVPDELLCLICRDLLSDAVVIPCCGNSYCDDCIRTTLLDSEEHVCPTCSQSDVSPDTLIANKFLRQAVNTFKKERGYTKSLRGGRGTSQSQNPTPTPSPVPTPPPLTAQSQLQKPPQSTHSQQDPLLYSAQAAADAPPSSQVPEAPPTVPDSPSSASDMPSVSLQTVQSHLEITEEAEEETHDDSAAAAPSVLVSLKDPTAAPSQLIPLVNSSLAVAQPQTVSVNQQVSSDPVPTCSGPSACWESSPSSSGCHGGGWNESNTLKLPPFSTASYPAAPPPLFPSRNVQTFLAVQQPLDSYHPGYLPTPTLQGAPIPSLCSTNTSIPALIPKEWYMHQRKKERSPHRGSTYKRSSSRSKSSKSKSSRSYSRSSSRSRSRSRSRSQGPSRPRSPYSRHRDPRTRSHVPRSYSYGYKRSPTTSSSSSPRVGYHSRSKSPSDHRKNSRHSRHHSKKSAHYSSRRRGERSQTEASYQYAPQANLTSSMDLDRERYLQWKREYQEWCEKYFNSYVGYFHQPPPLLNLPPHVFPQWENREGSRNHSHVDPKSRHRLQGRHAARSPPSHLSSDSRSPPSQSSSDSHSSPSHLSNDSRSPSSQSSSDGHSTPSKHGAQPRAYQQKYSEKDSHQTVPTESKEVELQECKDDKQLITDELENISTLKHEEKSMKKHEDKRKHSTGPNACNDGMSLQEEANVALESDQSHVKPDKGLDKDYQRKSREERNLQIEKGRRRKYSECRQDVERRHKDKTSKGADRLDTDRYRNPGGSKASDSRSEKNRKRKGEDMVRSSVKSPSNKCQKTTITEDPETHRCESPNLFERKKQKMELKKETKMPLTETPIWEEGIKVKPQKKISINIKLDEKRKEDQTEKQDSSHVEKTKEATEKTHVGEEEKLNREENEKKESSRDQKSVFEEKIKPEGEVRQMWEKATFRDEEGEIRRKTAGEKKDIRGKKEDREEEDLNMWPCALRGEEEESKQREEGGRMKASKGEEVTNNEKSVRGEEMGDSVAGGQKERAEGRSTWEENRRNQEGDSKPQEELMEGVKRRMSKEGEKDETRSKPQRSRNESRHDGPNTTVDDGSSYKDCQERKAVRKTLEENTQAREDQLVLAQVPRSKWEKEESEQEEPDEGEVDVQADSVAVFLPPSSVSVTAETPTNRETDEIKRRRSVETERGRDREREKTIVLSSWHTRVAPSSGKDRTDSSLCTDKDRERRMEMEGHRDRGRESERPRDRQTESKRLKERPREEERRRERGHSSTASGQKRNPPSSSHSYSTSHGAERRDRQRGGDQSSSCHSRKSFSDRGWESSTASRATRVPDQNANKTYRDMPQDSKCKDKHHPHYQHNYQAPSGSHRRHSPPSPSHSRGRELMQNRSRNEVEKREGEGEKVDKVIKEGKGEREKQDMVAETEKGGSCWEDEADKLDRQVKQEGGTELEDGERPSSRSNSVSSSVSQVSTGDDRGKKQKEHKKEKRHAAPVLLEDREPKKHKKSSSKKS